MRTPEKNGPRHRSTTPASRASIAPCIRWPHRSRGIASRFVYGEIERPAPYLRNGLWLSVVRRGAERIPGTASSCGRSRAHTKDRARSKLSTPSATWAWPPTVPRWIALTTSTPASPNFRARAASAPGLSSRRTTRTVRLEQTYPLFMIASRACIGWLTIRLTYDRPPADSAPIASMLIPASPRIAASFASSPGRSGTSMSIWIMSPREGHGSARLQALRAVAWRQIAYGMRSPYPSDSHALHPRLCRDPGPRHGSFHFVLPRCLGDAGRPASACPGNRGRMGGASQHRVEADARAELVPERLQVLCRTLSQRGRVGPHRVRVRGCRAGLPGAAGERGPARTPALCRGEQLARLRRRPGRNLDRVDRPHSWPIAAGPSD